MVVRRESVGKGEVGGKGLDYAVDNVRHWTPRVCLPSISS